LILIRLAAAPKSTYADREPESKYMHDDGGPSYWWKDALVVRLQKQIRRDLPDGAIEEKILSRIGKREPALVLRFERFFSKQRFGTFTNADDLLRQFSKNERRRRALLSGVKRLAQAIGVGLFIAAILSLFSTPYTSEHVWLWVAAGVSAVVGVVVFYMPIGDHFGPEELELDAATSNDISNRND